MKILIDTDGTVDNTKITVDDIIISCVNSFTVDINEKSVDINILSSKLISFKNGKLETIN